MTGRRRMADGPMFRFTYLWYGLYPQTYNLDLSGTGCEQLIDWERIDTVHTLDRGDYKRYLKGYQLNATLKWGDNALIQATTADTDVYVGDTERSMNLMFNTTCNQPIFYWPHPGTHPSTYFNVIWSGNYNFNYARGLVGTGFQGEIKLIGSDILEKSPTLVDGL